MLNITQKTRTNCAGADLRVGDELLWNGVWYAVIDTPVVLEAYVNGTPAVMAVPTVTVKGRETNTLTVDATAWVLVRRVI